MVSVMVSEVEPRTMPKRILKEFITRRPFDRLWVTYVGF
jgi:hypothetical protein